MTPQITRHLIEEIEVEEVNVLILQRSQEDLHLNDDVIHAIHQRKMKIIDKNVAAVAEVIHRLKMSIATLQDFKGKVEDRIRNLLMMIIIAIVV